MRTLSLVGGLLLAVLPAVSTAAGPISEPHALIYFQSHWSGRAQDTHSSLGLRLDRTAVADDRVVDFQRLLERPAMLELRIGRDGVQTFSVAGTDYAQWYRVHRADEASGSGDAGQKPAEGAGAPAEGGSGDKTGATAGAGKETQQGAKEEKKLTIGGILDAAPVGVIMGVGLGVFLLTGVGN